MDATNTPNRLRSSQRRLGFSLPEVLIVVACLSIIGYLAITMVGNDEMVRLRAAARLMMADIAYAQLASIGNGEDPCVMVLDTAANNYHLARASSVDVPMTEPGSGQAYITQFGSGRATGLAGVALESIDLGGDNLLSFDVLGVPDQSNDAIITLRAGEQLLSIRVDGVTGETIVE
jgi:prepilin-type N-terminal cleavage/methylation domain-containing protein